MKPWLLLLLALTAPLAADNLGFGLDVKGGIAVPASPTGPNSFSEAYGPSMDPDFTLSFRMDPDWQVGLEGGFAAYSHKWVADTALRTWNFGLMAEWDLPAPPEGLQDRLYTQLAIGVGGAQLATAALFQSRKWTSVAGRLALGWDCPLLPWLNLLVETDLAGLVGPGKSDPIATVSFNGGLRFGVPPKQPRPTGAVP